MYYDVVSELLQSEHTVSFFLPLFDLDMFSTCFTGPVRLLFDVDLISSDAHYLYLCIAFV